MDLMDLLILLLLVLPTPALAVLREFHFVNVPKNWTEAQSYCREKFFDLATIENAADLARVIELMGNAPDAWIGLYDDVKSWRWSLDNTSLYEREWGDWLAFKDDNAGGGQNCVNTNNGELDDTRCEVERPFICYDETFNSYIPVGELMAWESAQSFCRQTHTDLASIRNQQEWDNVMTVAHPSELTWVGLFRNGLKWSDKSHSSFREWANGEPHGYRHNCGGARAEGFFDEVCSKEFPFICSAPHRKVLKVMLKTDGSVNLNDPLVQEAVLKQMEKDLKGQGIYQDFILKWRRQPHGDIFNKTELIN